MTLERLSRTRLHKLHHAARLRLSALRARFWASFVRRNDVEAVLVVSHGSGWITGSTLAEMLGLPLHLICHDEWAHAGILHDWKEEVMGVHYRAAVSRFCVSPFMAEDYERRYGALGEVLYPSRANDAVRYDAPPARLSEVTVGLTAVFAGTINSRGTVDALRALAAALRVHGGRLLLYGPLGLEQAKDVRLFADNIEVRGLVPPNLLIEIMRAKADVLYVPMSFDHNDKINMQISFPSKLADYTAAGVPLLIHGPEYSSAVRWARENSGVAEVIVDPDGSGLDLVIARLAKDPAYRVALGAAALRLGSQYFGFESARDRFFSGLQRGSKNPATPPALL